MAAEVWRLVNAQSWIVFALMTLALIGLTLTYAWSLYERSQRRFCWLAIGAGLFMTAGSLLAGMQAGETPLAPREVMLPWVRLCWLVGSLCMLVFLTGHWICRIRVVR